MLIAPQTERSTALDKLIELRAWGAAAFGRSSARAEARLTGVAAWRRVEITSVGGLLATTCNAAITLCTEGSTFRLETRQTARFASKRACSRGPPASVVRGETRRARATRGGGDHGAGAGDSDLRLKAASGSDVSSLVALTCLLVGSLAGWQRCGTGSSQYPHRCRRS